MAKTEEWDYVTFADWVRGELRRREWNASDLARRMDTAPATVSRWLSGERRPSPPFCDLLADALGADLDVVLALVGHRPPSPHPSLPDERDVIISLLRRVKLTPDRRLGLEGQLRAWHESDRDAPSPPTTNLGDQLLHERAVQEFRRVISETGGQLSEQERAALLRAAEEDFTSVANASKRPPSRSA